MLLINKCQWSPLHRAIGFKASSRFSSLSNPPPLPSHSSCNLFLLLVLLLLYLHLHLHQQLSTYCSHKPAVYVRTLIDPPTSDRSAMNATDGSAAHFTPTMENSNFSFPFFLFFFFLSFSTICDNAERDRPALRFVFSAFFFPCFEPSFLCLSRKMTLLFLRLLRLSLLPPFSSLVFRRHRLLGISLAVQSFRSRNTVLIGDFTEIRVLSVTFLPCFSSRRTTLLFSLRVGWLVWFGLARST